MVGTSAHDPGRPLAGRSVLVTRTRRTGGCPRRAPRGAGRRSRRHARHRGCRSGGLGPRPMRRSRTSRSTTGSCSPPPTASSASSRACVVQGLDPTGIFATADLRVAVVGSATATRIESAGVAVDIVPPSGDFRAEGLIDAFRELGATRALRQWRVLIPRAAGGTGDTARGAPRDRLRGRRRPRVSDDRGDAGSRGSGSARLGPISTSVTFTSGSTVRNFLAFLEAQGLDAGAVMAPSDDREHRAGHDRRAEEARLRAGSSRPPNRRCQRWLRQWAGTSQDDRSFRACGQLVRRDRAADTTGSHARSGPLLRLAPQAVPDDLVDLEQPPRGRSGRPSREGPRRERRPRYVGTSRPGTGC